MMMTMNLNQRCEWIRKNWKIKIHRAALSKIYKMHSIHFLSAKYHFFLRTSPELKLQEQIEFVIKHVLFLREGREILY